MFRDNDEVDSLLVSDWIEGIQNKRSPDGLSILNRKHLSASIGGRGLYLETMYGSQRQVPLFEFRDLKARKPREFQDFVREAEYGIIG